MIIKFHQIVHIQIVNLLIFANHLGRDMLFCSFLFLCFWVSSYSFRRGYGS